MPAKARAKKSSKPTVAEKPARTAHKRPLPKPSTAKKRKPGKLISPEKALKKSFQSAIEQIKKSVLLDESPIKEVDIAEPYSLSKTTLSEYLTLDWQHRVGIDKIIESIRAYASDATRSRPLNIMMLADPGSGKSHFIKCLAKKMKRDNVSEVIFNMSSLQNIEDFEQPLEAVRNLKVVDQLPLLFLDEFDSNDNNHALLLPLLWDGELHVGHRELKLGKVVIVLAGSDPRIKEVMKDAKRMQKSTEAAGDRSKLADLLSRINGGELEIPSLDEVTQDRDRRIDKICISISLLEGRFNSELELVPWALLKFIADSKFRYGVRSIAHLVEVIPPFEKRKSELTVDDLHLPLGSSNTLKNSSLAYHIVDEDGPASVIEKWNRLKGCKTAVRVRVAFEPLRLGEMISRFLEQSKISP